VIDLILSAGWLLAAAGLLIRAVGQSRLLPRWEPRPPQANPPKVTVIVPARDEERNIGACLEALEGQTYPRDRLEIVVVDDHSQDRTAAIVAAFSDRALPIRLVSAPRLPPGWVGKCHACWTGAQVVGEEAEWLCFLDADVFAEPALLATALGGAVRESLDFLSLTPRQILISFAERLIMPCGLYLLSFRQDLRRVQSPDSPDATATGQFILVRKTAYQGAGGHLAVRAQICEDAELAKRMKAVGMRVMLAGGDRLIATRMYDGWGALWLGVTKNLVEMLGGPAGAVRTIVIALALCWASLALPALDGLGCAEGRDLSCAALGLAAPATLAAFGFHMAGAVFFRVPIWYGLLFPLGYSIGAIMTLDSLRRKAAGRVSWKGRTYP
jgi:chlorobactene glucosyltransferase